jgi:hypothetical protein
MQNTHEIAELDYERVKGQLGRTPRELREVVIYGADGWPQVIRVGAEVEAKPFPSLYWLTCKKLTVAISRIEAAGAVLELEKLIASDEGFKQRVLKDHQRYMADRMAFIRKECPESDWQRLSKIFEGRGIGGIANFSHVRCLHMHYAHHLVRGNTIGDYLESHYSLGAIH